MRPNLSIVKWGPERIRPTSSFLPDFCSAPDSARERNFSSLLLQWFAVQQVHRPPLGRPCSALFRELPSLGPLLSVPALPSSPGRWISLWLPSSFFTQESQQGLGAQKGHQASPPCPCFLFHKNPTSSVHAAYSMVKTTHAPASAPVLQLWEVAHTPSTSPGPMDFFSAPLASLLPYPVHAQGSSASIEAKENQPGWVLVPTAVTLRSVPSLQMALEGKILPPRGHSFDEKCLQTWLVATPGEGKCPWQLVGRGQGCH